jgi:hypothetical protein
MLLGIAQNKGNLAFETVKEHTQFSKSKVSYFMNDGNPYGTFVDFKDYINVEKEHITLARLEITYE